MATIYTHKSSNIVKTWGLMAGFLIFVIAVAWVFSRAYGNPGILYFGVVFSIIMNVVSYWYSDKLVLAMSKARRIELTDHPELYRTVENLAITAGLPMPKVYLIDDPQPNAFATGRDPEHAVVAVTTGLLERLLNEELEGVVAHELSHIGNRDMLISTVAVVLVGFVSLVSDWFLRASMWGGRDRESRAQGFFVIAGIVLSILAPLIASLMHLAISRKREFLADASGVFLTRYPDGLARALQKISSYPASMRTANHATAHLYIANPFRGKNAVGFLTKLFMTHPPIEDRIKALREMGGNR